MTRAVSAPARRPGDETLCPSGRCREGTHLIGVVDVDLRVTYVSPSLEVTADFVEQTAASGRAAARFRFAEPCAQAACEHWCGERCALIDRLAPNPQSMNAKAQEPRLPHCGIRPRCRWYNQVGLAACAACPTIIREPPTVPDASASAAGKPTKCDQRSVDG
jgi:hypothetical protein